MPSTASQIGDLKLGAKFDLSRYHLGGETVLLRNGRVLEASLPRATWASLEDELRSACRQPRSECEIRRDGETFLVLPVQDARLGSGFQLVVLRSLDAAVREFTQGWISILVKVGVCGVLLALLFTLATSRSVTRPLRELAAQLQRGRTRPPVSGTDQRRRSGGRTAHAGRVLQSRGGGRAQDAR